MSAQTIERQGERARLASWRGDRRVAHLSPTAGTPLSAEFVGCCMDWLRERGYTSVITNALSPHECTGFVQAGFDIQEELELLSHDLDHVGRVPRGSLRRARGADRPSVLQVDAVAFDPFWRLHEGGLEEALGATPHVRFRVAPPLHLRRGVAGYVVAGRGDGIGYLQRLAVHPMARRRGLGSTMVFDALSWMRRRGVNRALVNTQRTNQGALALYHACGFQILPEGLQVLARDL